MEIGDKIRCISPGGRFGMIATITDLDTFAKGRIRRLVWEDEYPYFTTWLFEHEFELVQSAIVSPTETEVAVSAKTEQVFSICKRKYYGIDCTCPCCLIR